MFTFVLFGVLSVWRKSCMGRSHTRFSPPCECYNTSIGLLESWGNASIHHVVHVKSAHFIFILFGFLLRSVTPLSIISCIFCHFILSFVISNHEYSIDNHNIFLFSEFLILILLISKYSNFCYLYNIFKWAKRPIYFSWVLASIYKIIIL